MSFFEAVLKDEDLVDFPPNDRGLRFFFKLIYVQKIKNLGKHTEFSKFDHFFFQKWNIKNQKINQPNLYQRHVPEAISVNYRTDYKTSLMSSRAYMISPKISPHKIKEKKSIQLFYSSFVDFHVLRRGFILIKEVPWIIFLLNYFILFYSLMFVVVILGQYRKFRNILAKVQELYFINLI